MTAIAGWISYCSNICSAKDSLARMKHAISTKKKTHTNEPWVSPQAALLSQVSITTEPEQKQHSQPVRFPTSTGDIVAIFSGDIYNTDELQLKLRSRGYKLRNNGAELILTAYMEWGGNASKYIDGVFAFAIWDERYQQLLLSRDRIGIEPLYYYRSNDNILFGSEIKAILSNPIFDRVIDSDGLRNFLSLFRVSGRSPWREIYEVLPGTVIKFNRKDTKKQVYWQLDSSFAAVDPDVAAVTVRELLTKSVKPYTNDSRNLGVLLSGGLDSSSITAIAAKLLAEKDSTLTTFSVDYERAGESDSRRSDKPQSPVDLPYANLMAQRAGTKHTNIALSYDEIADPSVRRNVISARDSLTTLFQMDISSYLLLERIGKELDVVLTGTAGDTLFDAVTSIEQQAFADLLFDSHAMSRFIFRRNKWLKSEVRDRLSIDSFIRSQYDSVFKQATNLNNLEDRARRYLYVAISHMAHLFIDRESFLAKAQGIQISIPFINHHLVEFMHALPVATKTPQGKSKDLLRLAVEDIVPAAILNREKSGYPANNDPLYEEELRRQVCDILSERNSQVFELVSRDWLSKYLESGESGHLEQVIDLYHWLDIYRPAIALE